MSDYLERLIRWRDVGDGPLSYTAGSRDFADDVIAALNSIDRITAERDALKAAAENFVAKVERREARSIGSYAEFKAALAICSKNTVASDDSNDVEIAKDGAP